MSSQSQNRKEKLMADLPPPPSSTTVHPPIPFGLGSQITLTGWIGAVVAFIISWVQDGMTPETVTLGATAGGLLAAFFAGRSVQAKAAIGKVVTTYVAESQSSPPEVPK
jgi:hypothetical protein